MKNFPKIDSPNIKKSLPSEPDKIAVKMINGRRGDVEHPLSNRVNSNEICYVAKK